MSWPNRTKTTLALVEAILAAEGEVYGRQLMQDTGMPSGVVYPILHRLERRGWLMSEYAPTPHGAQYRRMYQPTVQGLVALPNFVRG